MLVNLMDFNIVQVSYKFTVTCVEHACGMHVKSTKMQFHMCMILWVYILHVGICPFQLQHTLTLYITFVIGPAKINHVSANYTKL